MMLRDILVHKNKVPYRAYLNCESLSPVNTLATFPFKTELLGSRLTENASPPPSPPPRYSAIES